MATGRKTGGRKKGTPNKATAAKAAAVAASGLTPLDYMLSVLRDKNAAVERRDEMAKASAPYVHPRLSSLHHSGNVTLSLAERVARAKARTNAGGR